MHNKSQWHNKAYQGLPANKIKGPQKYIHQVFVNDLAQLYSDFLLISKFFNTSRSVYDWGLNQE